MNGTMSSLIHALTYLAAFLCLAAPGHAQSFTIRVNGRESTTVTRKIVQLSDVAEISSPRVQDDEVILALNRIEIAPAPQPGESISLSAHDVIGRMQSAGVKLSDIGYTFPRVLTVRRASRSLRSEEVQLAVEEFVRRSDNDASIRQVSFNTETAIAPDARIVEVLPSAAGDAHQQRFTITVRNADNAEQRIAVSATVDRWTQVAVTRRSIPRGQVVDSGDVIMARYSAQSLPNDAVNDVSKIIGLETKRDFAAGEVVQRNKLDIPAVIKAGEKVTLRYHSALIEATATGISLDAAGLLQPIRVKNESSQKIISGIVLEPGIVEVK